MSRFILPSPRFILSGPSLILSCPSLILPGASLILCGPCFVLRQCRLIFSARCSIAPGASVILSGPHFTLLSPSSAPETCCSAPRGALLRFGAASMVPGSSPVSGRNLGTSDSAKRKVFPSPLKQRRPFQTRFFRYPFASLRDHSRFSPYLSLYDVCSPGSPGTNAIGFPRTYSGDVDLCAHAPRSEALLR